MEQSSLPVAPLVSRSRRSLERRARRVPRQGGRPAAAEPKALGAAVSPYGSRSKFEKTARFFNQNTKVPLEEASSRTPLHDTYGIITPSSLHFERHHSGVPEIDPSLHTLTIHGMVDRAADVQRGRDQGLPSTSRIHFLECSGNSGGEWRGGSTESDVQRIHGLTSCSEWTGVPVSMLLRECGVHPAATWVLAEGADAGKHDRSIPMKKIMDDAMVVYAQNGEPLRPEQGYPLRLLLPGWEGNANVKWLRRLKVMNQPAMTPRGNVEVHRPDARRHGAAVHLRARSEVADHASVRRRHACRGAGPTN